MDVFGPRLREWTELWDAGAEGNEIKVSLPEFDDEDDGWLALGGGLLF